MFGWEVLFTVYSAYWVPIYAATIVRKICGGYIAGPPGAFSTHHARLCTQHACSRKTIFCAHERRQKYNWDWKSVQLL